jgi:lipopolysaccharide transport system ATP-binding protein
MAMRLNPSLTGTEATSVNQAVVRVNDVSKVYGGVTPGRQMRRWLFGESRARLLEAQDGGRKVLDCISLQVARGESLGLLGRNGAGKSTLLQIIAGTLAPSSGEVAVQGRVAALLELGSGFNPEFTGRENVFLNAALLGLSQEDTTSRFERIADFAEIGEAIDHPVKTYSSGMMLRLAFAVYTAVDPNVMIVDEALAVGDARFQRKCYDHLVSFRRRGGTVLFVTHDTGSVVQFCDRAIVLEQGRIHAEGAPREVAQIYHRLLFGGASGRIGASEGTESMVDVGESTGATQMTDKAGGDVGGVSRGSPISHVELPVGDVRAEVRYGSGEARIVRIGLLDAAGKPNTVTGMHERVRFAFEVDYLKDIEEPLYFGFMLSTRKGLEVFGISSRDVQRTLPPGPTGSRFRCTYEAVLTLVPGVYFLSGALAFSLSSPESPFLDYRFDAFEFELVGMPTCFATGVLDLAGDIDAQALESCAPPTNS